ncbi:hypothetical protein AB0942_10185 [Streptomyces nodosus]|uniref:hypothetical protein n=1 Tax=Streptomyces nodosus TaxID=40318 RepID=UPI00345623AE
MNPAASGATCSTASPSEVLSATMTSPVSAMVVTSRDWSSPRRAQARAVPYPLRQVTRRREAPGLHAVRYIISQGGQRGGRGATAHWHPAEENSYQYGLIDAHLTTAVNDLLSITRAEAESHMGMGKRYRPIAVKRSGMPTSRSSRCGLTSPYYCTSRKRMKPDPGLAPNQARGNGTVDATAPVNSNSAPVGRQLSSSYTESKAQASRSSAPLGRTGHSALRA